MHACTHSGLGKNVIAVTIPIAAVIFLADMISSWRREKEGKKIIPLPLASSSPSTSSSPSSSSATGKGGAGGRVASL